MNQTAGRLLVVDDNENNRDMLSRRLVRCNYEVVTAENGAQALEKIRNESFDVVLLDIEMPEMSGLDVLREVRASHNSTALPIIMVTARHDSADIVAALDLGANDYVTKPIDFPVAHARIRTQLTLKRTGEALRESEERYALAAAGSNDGIWDWNLRNRSIYFSDRWKSMLGCGPDEIGQTVDEWFGRIHPEDRPRVQSEINAHLDGGEPHLETEHRVLHKDGAYRWMLSRGMAVRDTQGQAYRISGSQTDITTAKVADPLTGLPNRTLFLDRLSRLFERAKRKDTVFAVLFLDIDHFNVINESLGRHTADQLLIAFSKRLEQCIRATDTLSRHTGTPTLARLVGDEFTLLLEGLREPQDAAVVARRIAEVLKAPFLIGEHELHVAVSIGVATNSAASNDPEGLLRDADTAMYRAKANGRGRIEVFDMDMRVTALARVRMEAEIRRGIERNEFENWYQLIVSLDTGEIGSLETLVRWNHPTRGLVPPGEFIALAEETGLIVPIGEAVFRNACRHASSWRELNPSRPAPTVAVNLSCVQFSEPNLVDTIKRILSETGVDPSMLTLEITESVVMADPEKSMKMLRELKALGLKLGMDDFGTGHSSLSNLQNFPFDSLKIDRSFLNKIETDSERVEIVRTILALAHNLKLKVVAEGVETAGQLALLQSLGCEYGQGYYFAKPVNASATRDLIAARPCWAPQAA